MNDMNNVVLIEAQMFKSKWNAKAEFKDAMRAMFANVLRNAEWASTADAKFKVAVGAAILSTGDEEREWLQEQMKGINQLGAVLNAAQVGIPVNLENLSVPENPRDWTLMALWHEERQRYEKETGIKLRG